jgi:hypothetical protein
MGAARNNGVPANARKGVNDAQILPSPHTRIPFLLEPPTHIGAIDL